MYHNNIVVERIGSMTTCNALQNNYYIGTATTALTGRRMEVPGRRRMRADRFFLRFVELKLQVRFVRLDNTTEET